MRINIPNRFDHISQIDTDNRPLGVRTQFDCTPPSHGGSLLTNVGHGEAVLVGVAFVGVVEVDVEVEILAGRK